MKESAEQDIWFQSVKSPTWQSKGTAAAAAESSLLDPQAEGGECALNGREF